MSVGYFFCIKYSKFYFALPSIEYLNHIVSDHGVGSDMEKISAMKMWPSPSNIKQLNEFLGLTNFIHKFVKSYVVIDQPLFNLVHGEFNLPTLFALVSDCVF